MQNYLLSYPKTSLSQCDDRWHCVKLLRYLAMVIVALTLVAYIPPLRNVVFYSVIPNSWRALGTRKIIEMVLMKEKNVTHARANFLTCENIQVRCYLSFVFVFVCLFCGFCCFLCVFFCFSFVVFCFVVFFVVVVVVLGGGVFGLLLYRFIADSLTFSQLFFSVVVLLLLLFCCKFYVVGLSCCLRRSGFQILCLSCKLHFISK